MTNRSITATVAAVCAGVLLVSGCSSKSASSVSQSKLESKLKSDKDVTKVTDAIPNLSATNKDKLITCIAKTLRKDADGGDLQDYVDGDTDLNGISGASSSSKDKAQTDVQNCVKASIGTG